VIGFSVFDFGFAILRSRIEDRRSEMLCVFAVFCTILVSASVCCGQTFGKNKVTSQHFDWMTYKTTHFTIYYYPDAERLVRTMADAAEVAYAKISSILEHDISKTTPLILYKSHGDFQQTNVILEPLGEGVGGFAELLKYRIVIPFTGSIDEFQKVITHEITHIFQYDILYRELFAHIYSGEFLYSPPLWFLEGMSEYMADHWDAEGRMVLRDAVIANSIVSLVRLQDFSALGARVYLGYKEGQSAVQYLAEKYGVDKLSEILRELRVSKSKDMDSALKNSIGIGLEKFDREWQQAIKKQYWPRIADKQSPDSIGTNLTERNRGSDYNIKPAWSPSGDLIAYITSEDGYDEIRTVSAKDGKLFSRITKRIHGEQYDSIREKGSGLAWSSDGDKIAFVGTKKGKDFLLVVDVVTGKLINRIEMPFDAAYSPAWSPDSDQVVIIGLKDGRSNIYLLKLEDAEITQLTSDAYDENSPSWHPSEPKIAYSSERDGRYEIFTLNLSTQQSQQITYGRQNNISPSWTADGRKIVFCSDMNDIYDVYTISADGEELTRLTNILTGCFNPLSSPVGDSIALVMYHEGRRDIYVLNSKEFLNEKIPLLQREEVREPVYVVDDRSVRGVKYSLSFAPDLIFVSFGYMSGGTIQNTVQFVGSDIMGDHRFMAGVDFASFPDQPDLFLAYYYLRRRPDFGTAIFNWNSFYIEGEDKFWQRNTGIAGYLSYPLDQFFRVDLGVERYLRFVDYTDEEKKDEKNSLTLFGLSVVKDVVVWSNFGPYSGMRYNLSLEQTVKLSKRDLEMTNIIMDFRKYFKLGQRSNFAVRLIGAASMGEDKEKFYLGSSFSQAQGGFYFTKTLMRGYDYNEVSGNRVGLLNLELRIPFIDELRFGWPFAWGLGGIRGVLFMDFAGVWPRPLGAMDIYGNPIAFDNHQFKPWISDDEGFRLMDLRASIGTGFRIGLGSLSLSFDFAKKTDLRDLGSGYKFHFGLGQEY
jgi:hypothetical protein